VTASTVYILYFVFALGGAAVYLLLPQPERSKTMAGGVLGVAALAALIVLLAARVVTPTDTAPYFYLFAAIAVFAAARVITHTKPVYSALYFVLVVVAVAALLVLQQAEFLAVALIIIYAGAIIVTYLFVIMLAQRPEPPAYDIRAREPLLAVLVGFVLMAAVAGRAADLPVTKAPTTITVSTSAPTAPAVMAGESNTSSIGWLVMTRYVVALEIAGVLLLVAMIGAIALSKKKVPIDGLGAIARPLGQVGREVPPF